MDEKHKQRRFGLQGKLNTILITSILLISVGLVLITYKVYCVKVDSFFLGQAQLAARAFQEGYIPYGYVTHLRDVLESKEFQEVRARAVAEGDEQILRDWMNNYPPVWLEKDLYDSDTPYIDDDGDRTYSLYGNYKGLLSDLSSVKRLFNVNSVYLQYYKDGLTYTMADPDEGLMSLGKPEKPIEAFSEYVGDVQIPPTVYQYEGQWLCTACEPIMDYNTSDEPIIVGMACVDIDMNSVVQERHWFLINCALFIAGLTLAAMGASLLATRKLVTKPLVLLSNGAMGFAREGQQFSEENILELPINSNDEIGDLYEEIRSMQKRIVESADRLTKITAERERINTELQMATSIQRSMLPNIFPPFPEREEFDIFASMDPAKEVGGDFYDYFMVDEDHLCLLIADVSGKGVPAALFMMSAKILLKHRAQMGGSPGEILTSVNNEISADNESNMFVTVWMGLLDINTGVVTCANAGHEFPFIRSKDGIFRVLKDKHYPILGVMKRSYTDYTVTLEHGDAIFLYTDGVPEASNSRMEMYGMERLEETLNRSKGEPPKGILHSVRADVDVFVSGAKQFDDLTMVCLVYK